MSQIINNVAAFLALTTVCWGQLIPPPGVPAMLVPENPPVITEYECGTNELHGRSVHRIVGGDESTKGAWPWQVFLHGLKENNGQDKFACGGTLISPSWVVTAAHCTEGLSNSTVRLVLGDHHKNRVEDEDLIQPVARIVDHPDYDSRKLTGDISLLQLAAPVELTDYIRPICLPSAGDEVEVGTQCTISGWGAIEEGKGTADVLRDAEVPILSNNQCSNWLGGNYITEENICAGLREGGKDSCQGDSGGPLACPNTQGQYSLEGVVSWGFGCADRKSPGVYTRVSEFMPWITKMMEQYKDAPEFFQLETTPCGSVITTEQTIRLPVDEKTHLYEDGMDCKFTIKPPANHKTKITFVERFAIEPTCKDFVAIYNENGAVKLKGNSKELCQFGGLDKLNTVVEEGDLEIRFESDNSANKRYSGYEGFAAKIEFTVSSGITTTTVEPTTSTQEDCYDIKPLRKCQKALWKDKCHKKGNKKKCRLTCGYCQLE